MESRSLSDAFVRDLSALAQLHVSSGATRFCSAGIETFRRPTNRVGGAAVVFKNTSLPSIDATETLTGCAIERAYVDTGYRGHGRPIRTASSSPVRSAAPSGHHRVKAKSLIVWGEDGD